MFSLTGKKIIITGASSGIGKQVAIDCAQMGAEVIVTGRNDERLNRTRLEIEAQNGKVVAQTADLSNESDIDSFVEKVNQNVGEIDGFVHCAGISTTLPLRATTKDKFNEFVSTNIFSTLFLTKRLMKKGYTNPNGSSFVFFTSVMASFGQSGKSLYAMTKGSLVSASKSLALEYAERKIRFNCISPSVIISPMSMGQSYAQNADTLSAIEALHPLGLGKTSDVSGAVVFLLSDAASWITGTELIVDGGYSAK